MRLRDKNANLIFLLLAFFVLKIGVSQQNMQISEIMHLDFFLFIIFYIFNWKVKILCIF